MDLSFITELISPLALAGALAVGYILKNLVPSDGINRFIPMVSAGVGILITIAVSGFVSAEVVVGGAISGLAATGLYEAFDNFLNTDKKEKTNV